MTILITFAFVIAITLIAFAVINLAASKPNGNILLGVTLPYDALNDVAVSEILSGFRKSFIISIVVFLLLGAPMLLLYENVPVLTGYLMVWVSACAYTNYRIVTKHFDKLYSLKQEKQWWVGERNILTIDTEVSRLKSRFPISAIWYLIPLIITMIPFVWMLIDAGSVTDWSVVLSSVIMLALFFLVHIIFSKSRTTAPSEDTQVNIALNQVFKREWTKCTVILATLNSLFFTALFFLLRVEGIDFVVSIAASSVFPLAMIMLVLNAHSKIRRERNNMLRLRNEEVCTDDDIYWKGGVFYYNPNDGKVMVEKRVGIGMTINLATLGGKAIIVLILLVLIATLGLTLFLS